MDSNVLNEIVEMAEFDPEEIKYIRQHISAELNEKFDDDTLQYIVDVMFEYIEQKDDEEDIILDDVAQYVVAMSKKENMGNFDANEIADIIDADFDFMESEDA
ncbi:MAG: hypothetical protein MJZ60_03415 [Bacteroidaceae bacterium]|nr:hypothetical protein [Bacteroidaceae bacterium]